MRGRVCLRWASWSGSASSRCAAWRRSSRRLMRMLRRPPGAHGAGLAIGKREARGAGAVGAWPAGPRFGDPGRLALGTGDPPVDEIDGELVFVDRAGVGGPREVQWGEHLGLALLELLAD